MSYCVSAKVYLGLPIEQLADYNRSIILDVAEEVGMDISYSYDDVLIVGYELCSGETYGYGELTGIDDLEERKKNFKEVFGVEPKLYLTVNIT